MAKGRWVKVEDILKTACYSIDFSEFDGSPKGWMEVIQSKGNDSGFMELVDDIMECGWEPDSCIGFKDGEITEGHHRLVAAILLCLDEVKVCEWGQDVRGEGKYGRKVSAHLDHRGTLGIDYF